MNILNLDSLKSHINIVDIISHFLVLQKQGRNFTTCCPFHNEKTPSFIVNEIKGMYYCFGCHAGGDAFKFVQDYCKVDFLESCMQIANIINFHLEIKESKPGFATSKDIIECNQAFLNYCISNSQVIESYVLKRGITKEVMQDFKIGFAGENFEIIKALQNNNIDSKLALQAGLIQDTNNGFISYFNRRLIIPIFDSIGKIIAFSGRVIALKDKEFIKTAKYINSKESLIYKKKHTLFGLHKAKETILKKKEVYIVEGYFDVLALHSVGITQSVALCGTALTKEHIALLKKYDCNICLALDSDNAGLLAIKRSIELLLSYEIYTSYILDFESSYKDCNDILLKEKDKLLNPKKIPIIEFYIRNFIYKKFSQNQTNNTIEYKDSIIKELKAFLQTIKSEFIKNEYLKFASRLFSFNIESNLLTNKTQTQNIQNSQNNYLQKTQKAPFAGGYQKADVGYQKAPFAGGFSITPLRGRIKNPSQQRYNPSQKQNINNNLIDTYNNLESMILKSAFNDEDKIMLLLYYTDKDDFHNKEAYNAVVTKSYNEQIAKIIMNDAIFEYENIDSFILDLNKFLKLQAKKRLKVNKTKDLNVIISQDIKFNFLKDIRKKLLM